MKSMDYVRPHRAGVAYNVYSRFGKKNHNILWLRVFTHPAVLIAVILLAFALVGTIEYNDLVRQ